jgi:Ti-type conjugative transfer relaxase TraA
VANEHIKIVAVQRSQGHSAVAGAAYRLGVKLTDHRTGRVIDQRNKQDVLHAEILAPEGAPAWLVSDASRLWNEAERCELRRDSRVAREVEFSLPNELTLEQSLELAREILREQFVSRGMIAHFAIHAGKTTGEKANPHVHALLTTRRVGPEGFSTHKERGWDAHALVLEARAGWAESTNRALAMAGHEARVDHRSYAARGIGLEPQRKVGRARADAPHDQREKVQRNQNENDAIRERNVARLFARPELAFDYLTNGGQRATFRMQDLVRFIRDRVSDEESQEDLTALALASPELVRLPDLDARGYERFTTRAQRDREAAVLRTSALLASRGDHAVDDDLVEQAIELSPYRLNDEQVRAIRYLTKRSDLAVLEGYAGTGKTSVAGTARLAWESQGYQVHGAALANVAADGLTRGAGIPARSIHSWLWSWNRGRALLSASDVLVVDEFGMVGTKQCAELVQHVRAAGAKLVLLGDPRQLPAIDPGAPMRLLTAHFESERLTKIVRQEVSWQRDVAALFARHDATPALRAYHERGRVASCANSDAALTAMVKQWTEDRASHRAQTSLLLAYRRDDVRRLNELARESKRAAGELGRDQVLQTPRGERSFAVGDRVLFYKSSGDFKNGQLGTLEWRQGDQWVVRLDSDAQVVLDTRDYDSIDHGYAGTLHRGQGATVDRSYVLASRHLDASGVYVAMSRHRHDARLYFSREEFADADELIRKLARVPYEPMAYELDVARAERLVESLTDGRFLDLPETQREEVLQELERVADRRALDPADALSTIDKVHAAEREHREAALALTEAERALDTYREANPTLGRWRSRSGELETAVRERRAALEHQERILVSLRSDPDLLEQAATRARTHNDAVTRVGDAWAQLRSLDKRDRRHRLLGRVVRAENRRQRRIELRTATRVDDGREFELVRHDESSSPPLMVLRERRGAPLVVAHAASCDALQSERIRFRWRAPVATHDDARTTERTRSREERIR